MNKKIPLGIAIGLMALAAAATFIITYNYSMKVFNATVKSVSEKEGVYSKLSEMDKYVRENYVGDIDEDALINSIMKGYVRGLNDPYAEYYTAAEYAELSRRDEGVTVGLGFTWDKEESGYIKVISVTDGSSAANAGLSSGDIITAVNNTDVIAYENGYDEAVALLNCAEGTKVKLHIKRTNAEGLTEFFSVDVVSEKTEIVSVTGRLIDNTAYVKISAFNDRTAEQFRNVLNGLIEQGAEALIFDVRNNGGGLVDSLGETLNCIIGDKDVVTAYFADSEEVVVRTTEAEKIVMPMTVIVNGGTASSAELFAFALRDECNAQIVGTSSYGKGVMQYTHKLTGGAAVRITVATLQTSNSGDYNGIGIKPNFDVSLPAEVDISTLTEEEQLAQDTQLIKAIEVVQTIK